MKIKINTLRWNDYFKQIQNIFSRVFKADIVEHIDRFGMKYVDYFKDNIFDNINIQVIESDNQESSYLQVHRGFSKDDFEHTMIISK